MSPKRGTIAYCTVPKIGGTYNFFRHLRAALEPLGWNVVSPVVGRYVNSLWDPSYPSDGCVSIARDEDDLERASRALVDWCRENHVDILLPMSALPCASAIPHFDPDVRVVMRCSNITRHNYDIVTVYPDRVAAVVATSKRQYDDLRDRRHVPQSKLELIPHGIEIAPFDEAYHQRQPAGELLRIGYVGRLRESAKNVLLLPKIARILADKKANFHLTVVGDGPDRARLEQAIERQRVGQYITLLGDRTHKEVPGLLANMDVFVMTSRFEGFGFSLIEAMAAGAVPVVSRIAGVTDWIVEHERTGYVCGIEDAHGFATRLFELGKDAERRRELSRAAHDTAIEKFSLARLGADYDRLFSSVLESGWRAPSPEPWSSFRPCPGFEPTFRRWIPRGVKYWIRSWIERMR